MGQQGEVVQYQDVGPAATERLEVKDHWNQVDVRTQEIGGLASDNEHENRQTNIQGTQRQTNAWTDMVGTHKQMAITDGFRGHMHIQTNKQTHGQIWWAYTQTDNNTNNKQTNSSLVFISREATTLLLCHG